MMTKEEIELLEKELDVVLSLSPLGNIKIKGTRHAVNLATKVIADARDDIIATLRDRTAEEEIEREIPGDVPPLDVQRENYVRWALARGPYYLPTESELKKMFSALEPGDEVIPDYAHSFLVRKPNGMLIRINRMGQTINENLTAEAK